jgi:hypothetical protein
MYTFIIDGTLKPGMKSEFLSLFNSQILPTLKKQTGFVDEILLFGNTEPINAVGVSLWNSEEDAQRYQRDVFPKLANTVQHVLNATPTLRGFNVMASETFRIPIRAAA